MIDPNSDSPAGHFDSSDDDSGDENIVSIQPNQNRLQ